MGGKREAQTPYSGGVNILPIYAMLGRLLDKKIRLSIYATKGSGGHRKGLSKQLDQVHF